MVIGPVYAVSGRERIKGVDDRTGNTNTVIHESIPLSIAELPVFDCGMEPGKNNEGCGRQNRFILRMIFCNGSKTSLFNDPLAQLFGRKAGFALNEPIKIRSGAK